MCGTGWFQDLHHQERHKISSELNLNGATLFIEGELSTKIYMDVLPWSTVPTKRKIYILKGGTLHIDNNNNALFQSAGVYCYNYGGALKKEGNNMYLQRMMPTSLREALK